MRLLDSINPDSSSFPVKELLKIDEPDEDCADWKVAVPVPQLQAWYARVCSFSSLGLLPLVLIIVLNVYP